jgi:hypothetical protein
VAQTPSGQHDAEQCWLFRPGAEPQSLQGAHLLNAAATTRASRSGPSVPSSAACGGPALASLLVTKVPSVPVADCLRLCRAQVADQGLNRPRRRRLDRGWMYVDDCMVTLAENT